MSTNQFRRYLDLLNEELPELPNTTQTSSEPRCAVCGTPKSQHQALKHQFVAGGAADRPAPVAQGGSAGGGDIGRVKRMQAELKAAGADLGDTGANRDGIDGDIGPLTTTAMDKYPNIAAKYPDLQGSSTAQATGQAATPAVDIEKLDTALTAIEGILSKYKVKLSEDCESSTTDQMKQWRRLVEYREVDEEFIDGNWYPAGTKANAPKRNPTGDVPVPSDFGKPPGPKLDSRGNPLPDLAAVPKPPAGAAAPTGPAKAVNPKPSSWASNVGKKILSKLPGLGARTAGRAGAAALSGPLAAIVGALGTLYTVVDIGKMLYDVFKDSDNLEGINDADRAVIKQNLEVVNSFMKDPKVADTLPQDIKTRVENVYTALIKLSVDTGSTTPAATQQTATPAATQQTATPAAKAAKAAVPAVDATVTNLDKLLKKYNFESRKYRTLSEQLACDRDIVDEGLGRIAYRSARRAGQDIYKGIGKNIVAPATRLVTQAATVGGIGYGGYKAWEMMNAPKTMSAADKAEFERIMADYKKAVPDQATFDALPQPVQEKLIDLADRLVKMQQQQTQGN